MIEYRKLIHEDYKDIVDISKDIWDGADYLPDIFHSWIEDGGEFIGAVDSTSNKVIGVDKYSILHDGTGWLEGLRVHRNYRGRGIAKELTQRVLNRAKEDIKTGKINRIAFSAYIDSVESISLMKKLGFKLEQEYIIVTKNYESLDSRLTLKDFNVQEWDLDYEEFKSFSYFKKRNNILPFAFCFQQPTSELFNELKKNGCFVVINNRKGMFKFKGEPHLICFDEDPDSINTFLNYYLLAMKGKSITTPLTSVREEDKDLIESLKRQGCISWNQWKCDYLYFVYKD
jgi:RimJ/RimL family protein N-acetyltransferase